MEEKIIYLIFYSLNILYVYTMHVAHNDHHSPTPHSTL